MATGAEKKDQRFRRAFRWFVTGVVLVVIYLLLRCSGSHQPLVSDRGEAPPPQAGGTSTAAQPPPPAPVQPIPEEKNEVPRGRRAAAPLPEASNPGGGPAERVPEGEKTGLVDQAPRERGVSAIDPVGTGAPPVSEAAPGVAMSLESIPEPMRAEAQQPAPEAAASGEMPAKLPGAVQPPMEDKGTGSSQPDPISEILAEESRLESAAQEAMGPPVGPDPLDSPEGALGFAESRFLEAALPTVEYKHTCPDPAAGLTGAEGPPGSTFTDPVTGMSFVRVKGGCFHMGTTTGASDEKPVHEVCVDDFYLGEYEVTQAQYEWVMWRNPSHYQACGLPVESVSWEDARTFIRKLSQASGRSYRLPTEAEWEYAARTGWREEPETVLDEALLMDYAGYVRFIGDPEPVGNKPNGLGLYDMNGNVWEWVSDWYGAKYYAGSPRTNPQGPPSGMHRVIRAGIDVQYESQLAKRYGAAPGENHNYFGFRVAFRAETLADAGQETLQTEISQSNPSGKVPGEKEEEKGSAESG